jgi:TolB-like protein/tetratricopeptide (TPR) repeat protein
LLRVTNKEPGKVSLWGRLRRRGVVRVALSYLVIAWLVLQVGDVLLDPLGAPPWSMRLLIVLAVIGFPVALVMAWFLEITPDGIEFDDAPDAATRPTVRGLRHYADFVVIGLLLVIVAFLLVRQGGPDPEETATPVVAVLPFEELDSSDSNHFGDGFADTLIQKLGILDQVVVLASSSTFQFRDSELDLTEVATRLGASVLLQGSLRRAGGLLRLDAKLLDGSSRQQLWSASFRRPMDDVFGVQDEIANAIAGAVGVQLTPAQVERIGRPPTRNVHAYEVFLRAGREALESREPDRYPEAMQYLHDAIELDPDFALAHATLVEAMHLAAAQRRWDTRWSDFADEARAAAARAQELDPNLGEGYLAEAFVAAWEQDEGMVDHSDEQIIALTEKAPELSPNNPRALKMLSSRLDDPQRSLDLLTRAARIDPRSGIIRVNVAEYYMRAGDFEQAEQWLISAARTKDPYFQLGYKQLVETNLWDSVRFDRGARWGRAFEAAHPRDWAARHSYARSLMQLGAWEELDELYEVSRQLGEAGAPYLTWAWLHLGQWLAYIQGDTERAVELAERYIREFLLTSASWPDLTNMNAPLLRTFDLLALVDVRSGDARAALDRYTTAHLDLGNLSSSALDGPAVSPAVVYAILHRYAGQGEQADQYLRQLLLRVAEEPDHSFGRTGFAEFTIHAFLGETDRAIEALQAAVDDGHLLGWWGLTFGDFDDNYAAVLADPRFERLHEKIIGRVAEMRESFRANPDLPRELLLEAGLTTP